MLARQRALHSGALLAAVGAAFVFAWSLGRQLFDPPMNKPPPAEEARDATLSREQVAAWLGIPGNGVLCVDAWPVEPPDLFLRLLPGTGCLSVVVVLAMTGHWSWWAVLALLAAFVAPYLWRLTGRGLYRVDATPDGLTLRLALGCNSISWSDVRSIRKNVGQPAGWVLSTSAGEVVLRRHRSKGSEALAHAITQVLAARQSGEVLPRMSDVSAAAISPVSASVSAERGISAAGEEGGA